MQIVLMHRLIAAGIFVDFFDNAVSLLKYLLFLFLIMGAITGEGLWSSQKA